MTVYRIEDGHLVDDETNEVLPSAVVAGPNTMTQVAPFPDVLADLVERSAYKSGWRIWLQDMDRDQGSQGLTLIIQSNTDDSRGPGRIRVNHLFPVPPAAFNERSWRRWLFDRYRDVEAHECAEFFRIDDVLPYAPLHAPGNDPYMLVEATVTEMHTDNQGRVSITIAENDKPVATFEHSRPSGWGEQ